jgi:hypothetical protein
MVEQGKNNIRPVVLAHHLFNTSLKLVITKKQCDTFRSSHFVQQTKSVQLLQIFFFMPSNVEHPLVNAHLICLLLFCLGPENFI